MKRNSKMPRKNWRLSEGQLDRLKDLYLSGMTQTEVARRLNMGQSGVSVALRRMGVPTRGRGDPKALARGRAKAMARRR